jgi:glycyl-tRNA synthetase beta chain
VDLVRILARVDALGRFLGTDDGADLLVAYRRASNIVRIEQKKDARVFEAVLYDPDLGEGTERELSDSLSGINAGMAPLLEAEKFEESMELLSRLRGPVDAFFDRVTVTVDDADVRENRLRLLARINAVMNEVADFSTIEG